MRTEPHLDLVLDRLAEAAMAVLPLEGPLGIAAEIAAISFEAAAEMARNGQDPAAEFARIHGADPMLRTLTAITKRRFPQSDPVPSAADTRPEPSAPRAVRELFEGIEDDEESQP